MRTPAAGTSSLVKLHLRPECITLQQGSGIQDANTMHLKQMDEVSFVEKSRHLRSKFVYVR